MFPSVDMHIFAGFFNKPRLEKRHNRGVRGDLKRCREEDFGQLSVSNAKSNQRLFSFKLEKLWMMVVAGMDSSGTTARTAAEVGFAGFCHQFDFRYRYVKKSCRIGCVIPYSRYLSSVIFDISL